MQALTFPTRPAPPTRSAAASARPRPDRASLAGVAAFAASIGLLVALLPALAGAPTAGDAAAAPLVAPAPAPGAAGR